MKPAAILGQLVDAKNVATHKCMRLTIDVPVEQALQVIEAFGWPTMVDPVPVALARLNTEVAQRQTVVKSPARQLREDLHTIAMRQMEQQAPVPAQHLPNPGEEAWVGVTSLTQAQEVAHSPRPKPPLSPLQPAGGRSFEDLGPAQQAGMLCNEWKFRRFLVNKHSLNAADPDSAAEAIRQLCGVASRKDLAINHKARVIWHSLVEQYHAWTIASLP